MIHTIIRIDSYLNTLRKTAALPIEATTNYDRTSQSLLH